MILAKNQITQQLLHEYLDYNPNTGHLIWKKKLCSKVVVGRRAGTKVKNRDNRIIKIFGQVFIEHRLIWLYVYGYYPKPHEHIDHINHDEQDNRIANLRLVSQRENNMNQSKRSDNVTGVTGVWISTRNGAKRYIAEISANGKRIAKSFYTLQEAIDQRKQWKIQFGYHPNHGIDKPI
ncbi:HNH endonuclease signature motif containing protein [Moraxella marmotae]|uniref:HNH endonuclease signature motif containing protein n=1 Tax=Moraxella marmotae TaxID=3344520 RepID=UPI0035F28F9E